MIMRRSTHSIGHNNRKMVNCDLLQLPLSSRSVGGQSSKGFAMFSPKGNNIFLFGFVNHEFCDVYFHSHTLRFFNRVPSLTFWHSDNPIIKQSFLIVEG